MNECGRKMGLYEFVKKCKYLPTFKWEPESGMYKKNGYRMRENFDQLWEMIGKKGGHVYICGDAKMMAKDVRNIIVEVVQKGKQLISCKTV